MLNKELLNELAEIYKEDYGVTLNAGEVDEAARSLIGYFDLLAQWEQEAEDQQPMSLLQSLEYYLKTAARAK